MPRPPKKINPVENVIPVVASQDNSVKVKSQKAFFWIKSKARILLLGSFISFFSVLATIFVQNYGKTEINKSETTNVVDLSEQRMHKLESEIEKLTNLNKKTEQGVDILANNIKLLEKRLQANTDVIKRMCEYIVVITVDKKIIPRQCLSDYNWKKEEGL